MLLVVAIACPMLQPAATAAAEREVPADLAADPGALRTPPMESRPKFRWWWPTADVEPAEVREELRAMRDAGFGGVEQVLYQSAGTDFDPAGFFTPTYRERMKAAVEEATSLGMRFDMTLGPAWPMSSPSVTPETGMQDLHYGAVEVVGPSSFTGPVPDAPPPGASGVKKLVTVTAARVVSDGSPQVLDPASAVDLTSRVGADGSLSWAVPAGRWKLFGFWMRPSGATASGGGFLVPDHLGRGGLEVALQDFDKSLFSGDILPALRRNGGDVFEDSYEILQGVAFPGQSVKFWTATMLEEFKRRRGYDLAPLLPGVFAEFGFPDGLDSRLKRDFQDTVTDLTIDNHLKPVNEWANKKGLGSRAQAYYTVGTFGTVDRSRLAGGGQKPDVESLGFGDPFITTGATEPFTGVFSPPGTPQTRQVMEAYRQVVSGAHRSGAKEVSNEWAAVMFGDFAPRPEDLKAVADHAFAAGVTTQILHGFSYRKYESPGKISWPGWCTWCTVPFSDSWNQLWPQMKAWPGLASYIGRISAAVRTGRPQVDLTILNADSPSETPSGDAADAFRSTLHRAGYAWDVIDPISIREVGDVSGGRLMKDGPAYRALIVNDMEAMPGATARRLLTLARDGLPTVLYGRLPQKGAGFNAAEQEDAIVRASIGDLRKLGNVRTATTPAGLVKALGQLDVPPDVQFDEAAVDAEEAEVLTVHRRTASGDVYFVYNNTPAEAHGKMTFAASGAPTQIDPWTGRTTRLAQYTTGRGTVTVPLRLQAGETTVLTFRRVKRSSLHVKRTSADAAYIDGNKIVVRDARGGAQSAVLSDGRERSVQLPDLPAPIEISGPWKLSAATMAPSGDGTAELTLGGLTEWEMIPELRGKSGTGIYTTTVEVPAEWLRSGRGILLGPGDFGGTLRAWINGEQAAVPTAPGERPRDVTALLRPGRNELRVEIATTLNNAMRTHALTSGDPVYARYAARTNQRYGLLGPVRLVPFAEAAIAVTGASKRCLGRRRFPIHVRVPRGFKPRTASMRVGKKTRRVQVRRKAGRRLQVVVDLRKRPKGTVRVRLTIRGRDGRVVRSTRTYRVCGSSNARR